MSAIRLSGGGAAAASAAITPKSYQTQFLVNLSPDRQNATAADSTITAVTPQSNSALLNSDLVAADSPISANNSVSAATSPDQRSERGDSRSDHNMQRTRRSTRNIEESSRRRSSRNTRQNGGATSSANGQALRPTLDLPPGYGNIALETTSYSKI